MRCPIWFLRITLAAAALFGGLGIYPAHAQLKLGQSVDMSGVTSPLSKDLIRGIKAHFNAINSTGGIKGQKVELVTLDDKFDPNKTLENTKQLIADASVVGLIGYRGTVNLQKIVPVIVESKIPLIGTTSGAVSLRKPVNPYMFHARASLADEIDVLISHALVTSVRSIAVVYQDDAYGKEGLTAFDASMSARGLKSIATTSIPRGTLEVEAAATLIAQANPALLIFIGQSKPAAALFIALKKRGRTPQLMVTSIVAGIFDELREEAHGVIVSQVVPLPSRTGSARIVQQYQAAMLASGETKFTHGSLEGYLMASVATRSLAIASPKPTRASLRKALDAMSNEDFGGYPIKYSSSSHNGSQFVDITMIRKNGEFAQ